jgi:Uncharacterized ACR, COG1678
MRRPPFLLRAALAPPSSLLRARSSSDDEGGSVSGGSEGRIKQEANDPVPTLQRPRHRRRQEKLEVGTALAVPSSTSSSTEPPGTITYLGYGSDAVVRLGCVLVAPEHETRHFLRRAAIFVYAMGERPVDGGRPQEDDDETEYVIRGLILDQPTAFSLSEMMPGIDPSNGMANLPIFRGGDTGQDGLILLQGRHDESGGRDATETTITATEISSGLYHGGWTEALAAAANDGALDNGSRKFKVFFNYCEFTEAQLEAMLGSSTGTSDEAANSNDDDVWVSLVVPPDAVLNSEYGPGEAWASFRNAVTQMRQAAGVGG